MSIKNIKPIPPIPLKNIPEPWKQVFKKLNQIPSLPDTDKKTLLYFRGKDKSNLKPKVSILPTLAEVPESGHELSNHTLKLSLLNQPAIQLHADMLDADWRIELYLLVKKLWNRKLKIPISRKLAKLYEPGSNQLYHLLQLCITCFDRKHHPSQHYQHAADWFLNIIQESQELDNQITIENEPKGKAPIIQEMREILAQMGDGKNPVNREISPHYYRLIEVGLSLNKPWSTNKSYWEAFISSSYQRIEAIEQPTCQETFVKDNKLVRRAPGPGRGTHLIISI